MRQPIKNHRVSRDTKRCEELAVSAILRFARLCRLLPTGRKKSFPTIGKGFRIRFEAPYYEEGVGVDGSPQDLS